MVSFHHDTEWQVLAPNHTGNLQVWKQPEQAKLPTGKTLQRKQKIEDHDGEPGSKIFKKKNTAAFAFIKCFWSGEHDLSWNKPQSQPVCLW